MKKQDENWTSQWCLLIFDVKCERLVAGYEGQSNQWTLDKLDFISGELTKWVDMEYAAGKKRKLAKISVPYLLLAVRVKTRCLE